MKMDKEQRHKVMRECIDTMDYLAEHKFMGIGYELIELADYLYNLKGIVDAAVARAERRAKYKELHVVFADDTQEVIPLDEDQEALDWIMRHREDD